MLMRLIKRKRARHAYMHLDGNLVSAIEMHVRMPGSLSLYEAHEHATHIETKLKQHFGADTHVGIHLEPIKVNGKYLKPE